MRSVEAFYREHEFGEMVERVARSIGMKVENREIHGQDHAYEIETSCGGGHETGYGGHWNRKFSVFRKRKGEQEKAEVISGSSYEEWVTGSDDCFDYGVGTPKGLLTLLIDGDPLGEAIFKRLKKREEENREIEEFLEFRRSEPDII